MYDYLKGKIIEVNHEKAVLEVNNIGYKLAIPANTSVKNLQEETTFFVSLIVREDSHTLFGFLNKWQRELFELFNTISGIGPKTALSLVGHIDLNCLNHAVTASDSRLLSKIPGIGKKTAERLIIELKDKLPAFCKDNMAETGKSINLDALNALINLGYNPFKAQKAVEEAVKESNEKCNLSDLITLALRKI